MRYHFTVVTFRCSSDPRPSWHSVIEVSFQDLNHMGRMVRVDINQRSSSVMWRRRLPPFSTLPTPSALAFMKPGSVPHYASGILVNFTPRLQLRGGVERIPGFMCSESRDAVSAGKPSHISCLQPRGVLQHMTFSMLSSTSTTDRAHAG